MTISSRRDFLRRELDRVASELERLEGLPDLSEFENDTVLYFKKRYPRSSVQYTFAAVKVMGSWYITGTANYAGHRFTDEELIEFIATGWPSGQPLVLWYADLWLPVGDPDAEPES